MTNDRQYISIKCLERACIELGLSFGYYDLNKNLIKITTPQGNLFFANSSTPFNSDAIRKITEDKFFTYNLIKNIISTPRTSSFFDPEALKKYEVYKKFNSNEEVAKNILKDFTLPVVVKRNSGRQGENVFLCKNETQIKKALSKIFYKNSQKYDYIALAQEYIPHEKEYRAIFYNQKLILLYEKQAQLENFTGNLSPLHFENSKTKEIKDEEVVNKITNFITPLFTHLPINFAGFDILAKKSDGLVLLEINTRPGFDYFVRDHSEKRLIEMYQKILRQV